jgi:hypothetical protein
MFMDTVHKGDNDGEDDDVGNNNKHVFSLQFTTVLYLGHYTSSSLNMCPIK